MIVEIKNNFFSINGAELKFPLSLEKLTPILGEPSQKLTPSGDACWGAIWDDLGIMCGFGYSQFDHGYSLDFHLEEWDPTVISNEFNAVPQTKFTGSFIINNKTCDHKDVHYIQLGKIDLSRVQWGLSIIHNFQYNEKIPSKKYLLKPLDSKDIHFADFNFKLLIIQELMYNQKLIKPPFILEEFVRWYTNRTINLEEEAGRLIPEVVEYFTNLPIPKKLASKIQTVHQDGGNAIYSNLISEWEGEDGIFDVLKFDDLIHFPHLKAMTLLETAYWSKDNAAKQSNAIEEIRNKHIDVKLV